MEVKMTTQQKHELIAKKLFGYKVFENKLYVEDDDGGKLCYQSIGKGLPNYTQNWQKVVEELNKLESFVSIEIGFDLPRKMSFIKIRHAENYGKVETFYGNTIGEAVVNATVEYFKAVQNG